VKPPPRRTTDPTRTRTAPYLTEPDPGQPGTAPNVTREDPELSEIRQDFRTEHLYVMHPAVKLSGRIVLGLVTLGARSWLVDREPRIEWQLSPVVP
jgi:hypothetical protein